MLIETCAGLLDNDAPEVCIRKEAIEETGYQVGEARKVFELYMSPGGVTELIHFFIAEYSEAQRANRGGGVDDEDIEVLELPFVRALEMIASGEIQDGKAVILLQYLQKFRPDVAGSLINLIEQNPASADDNDELEITLSVILRDCAAHVFIGFLMLLFFGFLPTSLAWAAPAQQLFGDWLVTLQQSKIIASRVMSGCIMDW